MWLLLLVLQFPIHDSYECEGTDLQGRYEITLDIEKRLDIYALTWRDGSKVMSQGFGVLVGDTMAVIYSSIQNEVGVINYKVSAGRLDGVWSVGDGFVYNERCTLGKPRNV